MTAASRAPLFVGSDVYRRAAFGANHPLGILRHSTVVDLARLLGWLSADNFREAPAATLEQLAGFHDRAYVEALCAAEAAGRVEPAERTRYNIGTLENPLFQGLFERASTTVGGSILAASLALEGHVAFHPSGGTHHGRRDRASGFCYFNDPVFAILTLLSAGRERVLYVDLDAHHGDGVELAFSHETRVTTVSIHEENRWPYTGNASSSEPGICNLPVPKGFNDSELDWLMRHAVLPLADAWDPDALVLCCGADSLAGDPLSGMMLSNVALWDAVLSLIAIGVPTVVLGGGGYNPWTVARYWTGLWGRINGEPMPAALPRAAEALLQGLSSELVEDEDVDPRWSRTLADEPNPGPVRDRVRFAAEVAYGRSRRDARPAAVRGAGHAVA